jgi:hypothetical protein
MPDLMASMEEIIEACEPYDTRNPEHSYIGRRQKTDSFAGLVAVWQL